jgi:PPOX class probable F420-dependent enzyme
MPAAPLPDDLAAFLRLPNRAVVSTVRPDGSPVTAATWYGFDGTHVLLSMASDGARLRRIRQNPAVALTALAEDWYAHLSISGRAVEIGRDPDLVDIDALSTLYTGAPYVHRDFDGTSVRVAIDRWETWRDVVG